MSKRALITLVAGFGLLTACDSGQAPQQVQPENAALAQQDMQKAQRPNHLGISPYLFEQRKRMIAGQQISDTDLRALADTGDAYSIWNYAERLHGRRDPGLTVQAIEYYAQAAEKGRGGSIPRIIELSSSAAFAKASPGQIARVEAVLRTYAVEKGDMKAAFYLVQRYNVGTPFGDKSDQVIPLLETLAAGDDARIALRLATEILGTGGLAVGADAREKARRYLAIASRAEDLSVKTTAKNLLALMERQDAKTTPAPVLAELSEDPAPISAAPKAEAPIAEAAPKAEAPKAVATVAAPTAKAPVIATSSSTAPASGAAGVSKLDALARFEGGDL